MPQVACVNARASLAGAGTSLRIRLPSRPPEVQAYIPEELGVPKPFPAAFKPFKPSHPPAAVTAALQRAAAEAAAAAQQQGGEQQLLFGVQASPVPSLASKGGSPAPPLLAATCVT